MADASLDLVIGLLRDLNRRIDDMEMSARESRGRMHSRLDEQAAGVAELRKDIEIATHVAAQQREAIKGLDEKIAKMEPDIDQWRQMRRLGYGFSGLLVALGMTGAGVLIYLGETARAVVRKWLGV